MLNDPILLNDWHVVAYAPDLKEGKPMAARLLEEDLVLWRAGDKIHAWRDLCLHRGTRLSLGKVENQALTCPYHGWTYNEEGQCIRFPAHPNQTPPATARVKVYQAQEKYNWIWVTLGTPSQDIPPFPQWDDSTFHKIHCGPYHFNASGPRAVENFLDVTHFPFVHEGILGDPAHPEVNDYEAEINPDGVIARDISVWQPDPDGTGQGARVTYTYYVARPLTAYFVKSSAGPRFAMYFTVTPVAERTSIAPGPTSPRTTKPSTTTKQGASRTPSPCKTFLSWNPSVPNSYRSIYKPNFTCVPTALPLLTVSGSDNWV